MSYLPTSYQTATGAANNRLAPGQSAAVTFKINASTLGLEDVIIIATLTHPAAPMQNFAFLAQPGLDRGGEGDPAQASPPGPVASQCGVCQRRSRRGGGAGYGPIRGASSLLDRPQIAGARPAAMIACRPLQAER